MHKLNETNENGWLAQITYGSVFIQGHGYQAGVFSQTFCRTKQMLVFFTGVVLHYHNLCLSGVVKDEMSSTFHKLCESFYSDWSTASFGCHSIHPPQWHTCVEFLLMLQIIIRSRLDTKTIRMWAEPILLPQPLANGYLFHMALVYTRRGTDGVTEKWTLTGCYVKITSVWLTEQIGFL